MKYQKTLALLALLLTIPGIVSAAQNQSNSRIPQQSDFASYQQNVKPVAQPVSIAPAVVISASERAAYAAIVSQIAQELGGNTNYLVLFPEAQGQAYFQARLLAFADALNSIATQQLTGNELYDLQHLQAVITTFGVIKYGDVGYTDGNEAVADAVAAAVATIPAAK
jgi:hypothetical protein